MKYASLALDALIVVALTVLLAIHAVDATAGLGLLGALIGARAIGSGRRAEAPPDDGAPRGPVLPPGGAAALALVAWDWLKRG